MKVITSHPAKQVVVYSIAQQLMLRGCLVAHLASVYYDSAKLRYGIWHRVPGTLGRRIDQQLRKRWSPGLPNEIVDDAPWVELSLAALVRFPWFGRLLANRKPFRIVAWFHDRRAARWIARQTGIDAVIAFQGAALRTLRAARAINAKAILMATHPLNHDRIVAEEYKRLGWPVRQVSVRRLVQEALTADYLVSASRATSEALREIGIPSSRIKEIPYGFDRRAEDRRRLNTGGSETTGTTRFLFVGKLSLHKGLHVLREAFGSIRNANVRLTLVGRPVGDCERQIVRDWNDPRVHIVEEVDDIDDAYSHADVFVFPSMVEGFGMVILEAMAAGLPVIVTTRCSTVVRDGVDGFVIQPGSRDELRERMLQFATCHADRVRLGKNAMQRAREFTWCGFGNEFDEWLRRVTATTAPL